MSKQERRLIASQKQNYRLWYNYLQQSLVSKHKINRQYYKKWNIHLIEKGMRFDSWWKDHKHLFVEKKRTSITISPTLSYEENLNRVKRLLKDYADKKSDFKISSKRFRYLEIDDYLKCYKLRQKGKSLFAIGFDLQQLYLKKSDQYLKSKKLVQRKFLRKLTDDMKNQEENVITTVLRKIRKCKKIIENTSQGVFPGEY